MTVITTCNYCGGVIEDNSYIEVGGRGHDPTGYVNVYYGHYCSHAATHGEESCYERVRGAIWLVNETGPALEAIETIPEHQVRQRRESFHRPGESSYATTMSEFCFATDDDATAAGFRPRAR